MIDLKSFFVFDRLNQPYARLDALYVLIFQVIDNRDQLEKICLVLGILYFRSANPGFPPNVFDGNTIEVLLEMRHGDLVLLLDPILSLVAIDGNEIRILHKSLFDYLLNCSRATYLSILVEFYREVGMKPGAFVLLISPLYIYQGI